MKKCWIVFAVCAIITLLSSCEKEVEPGILGDISNGVFIVNEGPFSSGILF